MDKKKNESTTSDSAVGLSELSVLKRIPYEGCNKCIFYKDSYGGCIIDIDSDCDPFACVVNGVEYMWVVIKN